MSHQHLNILIADDDADDRYLLKVAIEESGINTMAYFVEDGIDVLDFLNRKGKYAHEKLQPDIILLDLNMPKKDGRQTLKELKENILFKGIPVIIFTTSKSPDDIRSAYLAGANSYITKPSSFDQLTEIVQTIGKYWSSSHLIRS